LQELLKKGVEKMEDISVVELLDEILKDEKQTQILRLISNGFYDEDLLEQLLNLSESE